MIDLEVTQNLLPKVLYDWNDYMIKYVYARLLFCNKQKSKNEYNWFGRG